MYAGKASVGENLMATCSKTFAVTFLQTYNTKPLYSAHHATLKISQVQ